MKTEIPEYLIEWIEEYDFQELDAAKQKEVLDYLSSDDYSHMRETIRLLGEKAGQEAIPQIGKMKLNLSRSNRLRSISAVQIPVLRVAAILVICILGAFLAGYFSAPAKSGFFNSGKENYPELNYESRSEEGLAESNYTAHRQLISVPLTEDSLAAIFITGIYK